MTETVKTFSQHGDQFFPLPHPFGVAVFGCNETRGSKRRQFPNRGMLCESWSNSLVFGSELQPSRGGRGVALLVDGARIAL